VLFHAREVGYDFFVVLEGLMETVAGGRRIAVHGPLRFLGELSLLEDSRPSTARSSWSLARCWRCRPRRFGRSSRRIPPSAT